MANTGCRCRVAAHARVRLPLAAERSLPVVWLTPLLTVPWAADAAGLDVLAAEIGGLPVALDACLRYVVLLWGYPGSLVRMPVRVVWTSRWTAAGSCRLVAAARACRQ